MLRHWGARAVFHGQSEAQARQAAQDAREENISANHSHNQGLTLTNLTREVDTQNRVVRVSASAEIDRLFPDVVDRGDWGTQVQAAATVGRQPTDYAFLALEQNNPNVVNLISNVNVEIIGGSAMSNGGMSCTGNGTFSASGTIDAALTFSQTGNCRFTAQQSMRSGVSPVDDHLADMPELPQPSIPNPPGGIPVQCTASGSAMTCPAGRYPNAINYSGNGTLTFNGGTYQFDSRVSYNGNSTGIANPSFYSFQNGLTVTGNATVQLYAGIDVFKGSAFSLGNNVELPQQPADFLYRLRAGVSPLLHQ